MPGYADLPDEVLRRVLSGMLLTFYRSVHKGRERQRALFVVEGIPISHGSYETNADVGIIQQPTRRIGPTEHTQIEAVGHDAGRPGALNADSQITLERC